MRRISLIFLVSVFALLQISAQKKYNADISETKIVWQGSKIVGGAHEGTIDLKEGWLTIEGDAITAGEFIVDMTTIKNLDLKDANSRARLEGHLSSDDFFGVEKFPVARLSLTGSSRFINGKATVKGNMTIKSSTHPVEFTAERSQKGNVFTYTAVIIVDRSLYDVRFGSGKFFSNLGNNAIKDEFTLNVTLVVR